MYLDDDHKIFGFALLKPTVLLEMQAAHALLELVKFRVPADN